MSYQLYHTEGIVLRKQVRGEADAFFTVYTKDFGMVRLFSKGVMQEKSKLRGALDLFSHARISFIAGKELYRLTDAEVITFPRYLHGALFRFQAAGHIASSMQRVIFGEERDLCLWQLVHAAFSFVDAAEFHEEDTPLLLYAFQVKMLHGLGYLSYDQSTFIKTITESPVFLPLSLHSSHYADLDRLLAHTYAGVI